MLEYIIIIFVLLSAIGTFIWASSMTCDYLAGILYSILVLLIEAQAFLVWTLIKMIFIL